MSIVVALRHKSSIWVGSDQISSSGNQVWYNKEKFFKTDNEVIVGFVGSQNTTQYVKKYIGFTPDVPTFDNVVDWVHSQLKTVELDKDFSFIIAGKGKIFQVHSDFGVTETKDFTAIGSGKRIAIGHLEALKNNLPEMHPQEMVRQSLVAAIKWDNYCGGEIKIDIV